MGRVAEFISLFYSLSDMGTPSPHPQSVLKVMALLSCLEIYFCLISAIPLLPGLPVFCNVLGPDYSPEYLPVLRLSEVYTSAIRFSDFQFQAPTTLFSWLGLPCLCSEHRCLPHPHPLPLETSPAGASSTFGSGSPPTGSPLRLLQPTTTYLFKSTSRKKHLGVFLFFSFF